MVTAMIVTAVGFSLTPLKYSSALFALHKRHIFLYSRPLAALGPFILPTPLAGCVIGLSPQYGNKLALRK